MKRFDSTKPKYAHLFKDVALLTNFLHKRHMDLTYKVVGDQIITQLHMLGLGTFSHMCKITLTPNSTQAIICKV